MDTIISAKEQIVGLIYQIDWADPNWAGKLSMKDLIDADYNISTNFIETALKPSQYNYVVHTNSGYILYNTLFSSLSRLEQQEYHAYCLPECCNLELKMQLAEQGFFVPKEIDESAVYYRLASFLRQNISYPLKIVLAPTMACNARCFYCYEAGAAHSSMSKETAEKVVDWIETKSLSMQKSVEIVWFGGEPLLGVTHIDEISLKLAEKGIEFSSSMITNGSLFEDEVLPEQIKRWHLRSVQISIDGDEDEYLKRKNYLSVSPNCYPELMKHIQTLAENNVYVFVRLNIDRNNVLNIYRAAREIEYRFSKYSNVSFYPAFLTGVDCPLDDEDKVEIIRGLLSRAKTIMGLSIKNRLYEFPRISACDINNPNFFAIDPNGYIYSCEHALGKKHLSIGALPDGIIKNKRPAVEWRKECRMCAFLPKCFGGCYSAYATGDAPCFETKYMIQAYLELL